LSLTEDEGADEFVDHDHSVSYDPVTGFVAVEDDETFTTSARRRLGRLVPRRVHYDSQARLVELSSDGAYADDDFEFVRLSRQTWTFGGSCP
jgi:hypothetical protein